MELIENAILNQLSGMPEWVMWVIVAVSALLVTCTYIFPNQIKALANKYRIPMDGVDAAVRRIAMLAVKLYVVQRGIEDSHKIRQMEKVANLIDIIYPKTTGVRLSELLHVVKEEMGKRYQDDELLENISIVQGIGKSIVTEVTKVGINVNDNDNDPLVNPKDVSVWIRKGAKSLNKLK